jgi:putative proteasome-type protease
MTYCVGILLDEGLLIASDSRTSAGVDHVATFRKMTVFDNPGDRLMVMATAGNLAVSQAVIQHLRNGLTAEDGSDNLFKAANLFDAARMVGRAVRAIHDEDAECLRRHNSDFNAAILFGGQIAGERPRLFSIYTAGNFIEASEQTPYFQIGEVKYGKPILDRVITHRSSLIEAAKCALLSFDSTIRSNLSVAPPIDMLLYRKDSLEAAKPITVDDSDAYFNSIRKYWGESLRRVFAEMPNPDWPEM